MPGLKNVVNKKFKNSDYRENVNGIRKAMSMNKLRSLRSNCVNERPEVSVPRSRDDCHRKRSFYAGEQDTQNFSKVRRNMENDAY